MKKILLTFAVMICRACPILAMEPPKEDFDIRAITPIKKGMLPEQRREAIQSFLNDSLKPEYKFDVKRIVSYQFHKYNTVTFRTCTLDDGSEWVTNHGGLDRFLGYLYLKKAIDHYGLKSLCAVETRFAYRNSNKDISIEIEARSQYRYFNSLPVLQSYDFNTYSRYVAGQQGFTDKDLSFEESKDIEDLITKIGFTDVEDVSDSSIYRNMVRKEQTIHIYDTEYRSFSNIHEPYFDESGELTFTFPR